MQPYFLQYLIIPEKTKNAIDFTKETQSRSRNAFQTRSRACLKKAFCKMCVTICGRFRPDEGAVAGYGNRIRVKYTAKWGVQFLFSFSVTYCVTSPSTIRINVLSSINVRFQGCLLYTSPSPRDCS